MGEEPQPEERKGLTGALSSQTDAELDRKYWMALGLFAILAALAWFTLGEGSIRVAGRPVELRLVPLLILGLFAFRAYLARHADRIRRESAKGSSQGIDSGGKQGPEGF
jgi:hypothetical protein